MAPLCSSRFQRCGCARILRERTLLRDRNAAQGHFGAQKRAGAFAQTDAADPQGANAAEAHDEKAARRSAIEYTSLQAQ